MAAIELAEAENVDETVARLRKAGASVGTDDLGELRHRMLVLRYSLGETDPETIAIAALSAHELELKLVQLCEQAEHETRTNDG
jgi:hypothetical protein